MEGIEEENLPDYIKKLKAQLVSKLTDNGRDGVREVHLTFRKFGQESRLDRLSVTKIFEAWIADTIQNGYGDDPRAERALRMIEQELIYPVYFGPLKYEYR